MAQTWSKTPPTKDGYFWAKRTGIDAPAVVEIDGGKVVTHNLFNEQLRVPIEKTLYRAAEWSGPIVPPAKEKKAK